VEENKKSWSFTTRWWKYSYLPGE